MDRPASFFPLGELLGDYEAEGEPFPWSVGEDALPDEVARSPAAEGASAAGGASSVKAEGKDDRGQGTKGKAGALTRVLSEVMSAAGLPPLVKAMHAGSNAAQGA